MTKSLQLRINRGDVTIICFFELHIIIPHVIAIQLKQFHL